MNLIEIYLSEVGRHLPSKGRADIQAEIRSILKDMLEERGQASGRPVDDELTFEVLKEYGSPRKVAASYAPERYLIGPKLYPLFEKAMFALLPITILLAFGMAITLGNSNIGANRVIQLVIATFGGILWSVISTAGFLMVIFAIIQWAVPEFKTKEKDWDPHALTKLSPRNHISTGKLIAGILFTVAVILLFDFSPQTFSIGYYNYGGWWVCILCSSTDAAWKTTFLSEAFFRYLPFLNVVWILTVGLDVLLLRRGRWEKWSRWSLVGVKGLSIVLGAVILAGPSLIGVTVASLTAVGFPEVEAAGVFISLLEQAIRLGLALGILFGGIKIVGSLVRLFGRGGREVAPAGK